MYGDLTPTHMAAFLLGKAGEEGLPRVKLMKLMYLADREALRLRGWSTSDDRFVNMKYGPVLSHVYDLMKGKKSRDGLWEKMILHTTGQEGGKEVPWLKLRQPVVLSKLGWLSQHDRRIMGRIWKQFGHKSSFELVEYTHTLPEWEDPGNSARPLPLARVLEALGYSKQEAAEEEQEIESARGIDDVLNEA